MYIVRRIFAVVVLLATLTYVAAIVRGRLSPQQKLGLADIAVFVLDAGIVSVLFRPELLDRIKHFKFGELELDWLQKIEADQRKQRDELDALRFVLTLLLQQSELEHLRNLEKAARSTRA